MELITEWVWSLQPKSGLVIANVIQKHAVRPRTCSIIFNVLIFPNKVMVPQLPAAAMGSPRGFGFKSFEGC